MRQVIITRYHGPTNYRGSRISATCWRGKVVLSYDHTLDSDDNHRQAATMLCQKMNNEDREKYRPRYGNDYRGGWITLAEGELPDGKGMAHVIAWRPEVCA